MIDRSAGSTIFSNGRVSRALSGAAHPMTLVWKAFARAARARTANELMALAERYQSSQPALAAEFRAAASLTSSQGA